MHLTKSGIKVDCGLNPCFMIQPRPDYLANQVYVKQNVPKLVREHMFQSRDSVTVNHLTDEYGYLKYKSNLDLISSLNSLWCLECLST